MANTKLAAAKVQAPVLPTTSHEARPLKRRNRLPVSCDPCRVRRSKCDRGHPCATCVKRGEQRMCQYARLGNRRTAQSPNERQDRIISTYDRLRNLEDAVMHMIGQGHENITANSRDQTTSKTTPNGQSNNEADDPNLGRPHWASILNGIQELRSVMGPVLEVPEASDASSQGQEKPLLLGVSPAPSLQHVIDGYLPPRPQLDRKLSVYLRAKSMVLPLLHPKQFQSQYEKFWQSPNSADPIWVGLLFAVLSLSANISQSRGLEVDAAEQERFLEASGQCLSLGGYIVPRKHLIEALILLCQARYLTRLDPSREVSLIVAIIIRLAYQMGLHREPPASMSPFESEMHRRKWLVCIHFDTQTACQLGVPPNIQFNSARVNEPRNLANEDLDEDMQELPPSRPEHEFTTVVSFIMKSRLIRVLAEVYQQALSLDPDPDELITHLDARARQAHADLPEPFKMRPISQSFADSTHLVMTRLTCEFLAKKTICILHRKRMAAGHETSTKICVNAAMSIVRDLSEFYVEFQEGGQLAGQLWMLSLTILNDFLLATMILLFAFVTEQKNDARRSWSPSAFRQKEEDKDMQIDLLIKARYVCLDLKYKSRGARRVAEAVEIILQKTGRDIGPHLLSSTVTDPAVVSTEKPKSGSLLPKAFTPPQRDGLLTKSATTAPLDPQLQHENVALQDKYSTTQGPVSINDMTGIPYDPQYTPLAFGYGSVANETPNDPFSQMMKETAVDIDWIAFDQYINSWDSF